MMASKAIADAHQISMDTSLYPPARNYSFIKAAIRIESYNSLSRLSFQRQFNPKGRLKPDCHSGEYNQTIANLPNSLFMP